MWTLRQDRGPNIINAHVVCFRPTLLSCTRVRTRLIHFNSVVSCRSIRAKKLLPLGKFGTKDRVSLARNVARNWLQLLSRSIAAAKFIADLATQDPLALALLVYSCARCYSLHMVSKCYSLSIYIRYAKYNLWRIRTVHKHHESIVMYVVQDRLD